MKFKFCMKIITVVIMPLFCFGETSAENFEIFFCGQQSSIAQSDFDGNFNFCFGVNKIINFKQGLEIRYGFEYVNKGLHQNDVRLVSDSFSNLTGLTILNMDYSFSFLAINLLFSKNISDRSELHFYPILGIGYEINLSYRDNSELIKRENFDEPVKEYDYRTANERYPAIVANSGLFSQAGLGTEYHKIFINILYKYSFYEVNRIDFVMIDEQFRGLKAVLGVRF